MHWLVLTLALVSSLRSQALRLPVYKAAKKVVVLKSLHSGSWFQTFTVSGLSCKKKAELQQKFRLMQKLAPCKLALTLEYMRWWAESVCGRRISYQESPSQPPRKRLKHTQKNTGKQNTYTKYKEPHRKSTQINIIKLIHHSNWLMSSWAWYCLNMQNQMLYIIIHM